MHKSMHLMLQATWASGWDLRYSTDGRDKRHMLVNYGGSQGITGRFLGR